MKLCKNNEVFSGGDFHVIQVNRKKEYIFLKFQHFFKKYFVPVVLRDCSFLIETSKFPELIDKSPKWLTEKY